MQIQELAAKLEPLGLTDKEARVYVAALFLGPSSVQKIAGQADVNRATAYVILDQLCAMGLASQSQEGKKTVYIAEPPQALERLFDKQQAEIAARKRQLEGLLPELESSQRGKAPSAPTVRFYRGREGITASTREIRRRAKPGGTIYGLSNYDKVKKLVSEVEPSKPSARSRKRVKSKIIFSSKKEIQASNPKLLREGFRVNMDIQADVALYGDLAEMWTYADDPKQATGIVIENPDIVAVLRQLFELAWDGLSKKS